MENTAAGLNEEKRPFGPILVSLSGQGHGLQTGGNTQDNWSIIKASMREQERRMTMDSAISAVTNESILAEYSRKGSFRHG